VGGAGGRGASASGPDVGRLRLDDPREVDGYRVRGVLGEGGQGRVFLAADRGGKGLVALKVLLPEVAADPVARERIADQLELLRHLPGSAVVRMLAARVDAEPPYLVHEYVPGPSLSDRVRRYGPLEGAPWERLATATLDALAAIHRSGIVHHDLKPANILLGPDGPRISDFDLALRIGALDPMANEDGVMGSAAFLAPERLDAGPAIRASDVFAWAATTVYAATGRSPFHALDQAGVVRAVEHEPPVLTGVDPRVVPVLRACLEKDPARRPTAERAAERLAVALKLPGPRVAPSAPSAPTWGTPSAAAAPTSPSTRTATAKARPAWGTPSPPSSSAAAMTTATTPTKNSGCLSTLAVAAAIVFVPSFFYLAANSSGSPNDNPSPLPTPRYATTLAMSKDGVVLRFTPADVSVHRWSGGTWSGAGQVVTLQGKSQFLLDTRFSADGTRLATAMLRAPGPSQAQSQVQPGSDPVALELTVWDTATGEPVGGAGHQAGAPRYAPDSARAQVALSANGSVAAALAVTDYGVPVSGEVMVRRSDQPRLSVDLQADDLVPGTLALSADGRWLAYGHVGPGSVPGGSTRVVDLAARGAPGRDLPDACTGAVAFAAGRRPDQPVVLCRIADGSLVRRTPAGAAAGERLALDCRSDVPLSVSPDGAAVACLGTVSPDDRQPALWTASLRARARPTYQEVYLTAPEALSWNPSGAEIVVGFPGVAFIVYDRDGPADASPEGSGGSAAASSP
jgi:serine/threonine protein kinase